MIASDNWTSPSLQIMTTFGCPAPCETTARIAEVGLKTTKKRLGTATELSSTSSATRSSPRLLRRGCCRRVGLYSRAADDTPSAVSESLRQTCGGSRNPRAVGTLQTGACLSRAVGQPPRRLVQGGEMDTREQFPRDSLGNGALTNRSPVQL